MTKNFTNMLLSVSIPALTCGLAVPASAQAASTNSPSTKGSAATILVAGIPAQSQSPASPPAAQPAASDATGTNPENGAAEDTAEGEVVVTGYRASVAKSIDLKRRSDVMLDAISADDIASMPEANIAESLQRIPGISIDRDNGEGRQISVRGLGGDFTRVRVNQMEALSTSASLISGLSVTNQSRSFDFNTFASELFSQASVRKSTSAETDEGSLGATVDLSTPRPFNFTGQRVALNLADAYYFNGKKHSPRVSGLYSNRFFGDVVGLAVSGAFQKRDTLVSNYKRGPVGQGDLLYRGMTWAGNELAPRAGFAVPTGTPLTLAPLTAAGRCPGVVAPAPVSPIGTVCNAITNPDVLAAMSGSNAAAYAALYPAGLSNAPTRYDDSAVIIPSLPGLAQQRLKSERIGLTGSLQFKISDRTKLTFDGLYSKFDQTSDQVALETVGLGRNNTNQNLNTLNAAQLASMTPAARTTFLRSLYPTGCVFNAGSAVALPQDCGQQLNGTTPIAGFTNSFNPNNLDTYEYYNNPLSVGYAPNALGINGLIPLMGRPTTKVLAANVTNGVADYLQLQNVDWRAGAFRVTSNTEFKQASGELDHRFSDTFAMKLGGGWSNSKSFFQTTVVEFNALDRQEVYTIDGRGGGDMPIFDPGFDVSNPANWGIVKGLSIMRNNIFTTDMTFKQGRADFNWELNDQFSLLFGGSYKQFDYVATGRARPQDSFNPTEKEAGVTVASLGRTVDFGTGLSLPDKTPTTLFMPNIDAFSKVFGFDCDCINKFGDFRTNSGRSNVVGQNFTVVEKDTGGYF